MTENRWFVLPTDTDERGGRFPKYTDRDSIEGFSGQTYFFDAEIYPSLPFAGEEMYVAHVYGPTDALDALASEPDAYGKQEYGLSDSEVAQYLNDRLDSKRPFDEWMDSFGVSD